MKERADTSSSASLRSSSMKVGIYGGMYIFHMPRWCYWYRICQLDYRVSYIDIRSEP